MAHIVCVYVQLLREIGLVGGHVRRSRSLILVPIEGPFATSYY